jgi:hypothetical protein
LRGLLLQNVDLLALGLGARVRALSETLIQHRFQPFEKLKLIFDSLKS